MRQTNEGLRTCGGTAARRLALVLLAALLAACAGPARPAPPSGATPTAIPLLQDLPAQAAGVYTLVGLLYLTQDGALFAEGLSLSASSPQPLGDRLLWLGALSLPEDAPLHQESTVRYGPAQVSGLLQGPGAYGPAGQLRYGIVDPQVEVLSARDLDIALLLSNSALYEGQALWLSGQLLVSADSALLSERLGQGGVPDAAARQVKLAAPIRDQALIAQLRGSGSARYGPVRILGIWRGGALVPLVIMKNL